jgi:hypothetical protein
LKASTPPLADTARYDRLRADSTTADEVSATATTEGVEERNNCDFERISCDPERIFCDGAPLGHRSQAS